MYSSLFIGHPGKIPFTAGQDALILKVTIVHPSLKTKWRMVVLCAILYRAVQRISRCFFLQDLCTHRDRIIAFFKNKNCICKGKPSRRPSVLTDEVVDD